jgi:flagellar hook protein FlgE
MHVPAVRPRCIAEMSTLAVAGIAQSETRHSNQMEGTLTFDSNGNLTSPSEIVSEISFPGMADGASTLTFKWNLNGSGSTPAVIQPASPNNNGFVNQDWFPNGNYTGFTVDPAGVIQADFSNGNTPTIAQVAVATVANEQGLVATGEKNFRTTAASGQAVLGVAAKSGRVLWTIARWNIRTPTFQRTFLIDRCAKSIRNQLEDDDDLRHDLAGCAGYRSVA